MKTKTPGVKCPLCGYSCEQPIVGSVRGNTARFKETLFPLWKCPQCATLLSLDDVDFEDIYRDYPPSNRNRPLDFFAKASLGNLLSRLKKGGLSQEGRILDFGCGNGNFLELLKIRGYRNVVGYDPYVTDFSQKPRGLFDCVVANDVIEHVPDPRGLSTACAQLVKPGGLLYVGTADSEPVDIHKLDSHLLRLHQPFHRVILTEKGLHQIAEETGMKMLRHWKRSYMDTLLPFINYTFLDKFNGAHNYNMDKAMGPNNSAILFKKPSLFFYGLFGYFIPSAWEPAVLLKNTIFPSSQKKS